MVIIDVYRAFTTAAVAFLRGADRIVLVRDPSEALDMRERGIGDICVGEVDGRKAEGFEFGNSPFEMTRADLAGKTLIQCTGAGTAGVVAAARAEALFGASLLTASATAAAIRELAPPLVTLVAMGWKGERQTDEDEFCAVHLRRLLEGERPEREALRAQVAAAPESLKFGDPDRPHFHLRDKEIALRVDSVPFAIRIDREGGLLVARKQQVKRMNSVQKKALEGVGSWR